jgi:predicted aspartyl protease
LANGTVIEGKMVTLKSVRLGRFTVDNVTCVVFQEGLTDAATMLGSSFLSHFVVKLNQSTRELYLTEVGDGKAPAATTSSAPPEK